MLESIHKGLSSFKAEMANYDMFLEEHFKRFSKYVG